MRNTSARPADSIEDVMETYGTMLFRLCLVSLGNASDAEDEVSTVATITNGTASVSVALPNVSAGTYKLVITELTGKKKADQPLPIHGEWECEFNK